MKAKTILFVLSVVFFAACNSAETKTTDQPAADTTTAVAKTEAVTPDTPVVQNLVRKNIREKLAHLKGKDSLEVYRDPSIHIDENDKSYFRVFVSNSEVSYKDLNDKKVIVSKPFDLTKYMRENSEKLNGKKSVIFAKERTSYRAVSRYVLILTVLRMDPVVEIVK